MTKAEKTYDTGLRILEILKILLAQDISKREIIELIKTNDLFKNVYTTEAFIKYFNTLEAIGFKINKKKNIYYLENAFISVELSEQEINILFKLIKYINKINTGNQNDIIKEAFLRAVKYLNDDIKEDLRSEILNNEAKIPFHDNITERFKKLITENQLVSISFYKRTNKLETITVKLKEIIEKNDTLYVSCYDPVKTRHKKICIDTIVEIKQLPNIASEAEKDDSVVFELHGRLAASYKLKEDESLVNFFPEYIVVSNKNEDRELLLKRLLRYGENCRIVKPLDFKREYVELVDDILKNLKEDIV